MLLYDIADMTACRHLNHPAAGAFGFAGCPPQETGILLAGNIDILRMLFPFKDLAEPERLIENMHIQLEFPAIQRICALPENTAAFFVPFAGHDDPAEHMVDRSKGQLISDSGKQLRAAPQQQIDCCDGADQNAVRHILRIIRLDILHEDRTERHAHKGCMPDPIQIADRQNLPADRIQTDFQLREPDIALAVAGQVDHQHMIILLKQRDLILPDPRIAAEAVQQNDRLCIAVFAGHIGMVQHK